MEISQSIAGGLYNPSMGLFLTENLYLGKKVNGNIKSMLAFAESSFFFWSSWFSISHPYLSPSHQVGCSHISTHNSVSVFLTYEQVPLCVQISLVGQAALHDIEAVVVTGSHGGQASAVGAVQHLHEGTDAPRGWAHLWIFWKDWANQKFEGWVGEK